MQLSDLLVLDIETAPQTAHYDELSERRKSLWWNKISKTVPENITPEESYRMRAGILAEFGKIICISTAFFYENEAKEICLKVKSIYGDDERPILENFSLLCSKMSSIHHGFTFAGHNIKEFDIPYICRRMIINGLPLPACLQLHNRKPWEVKMMDTLNWWKFGDNKNYISLDLLAEVLQIPTSKTDINGSMVQEVYYKEKNLSRIVSYCERDVVVTANIILRFMQLPILKENQVLVVH
ncbi:ribonuclease H-like domain-containing protein [Hydrotalea sp.]|uniref:ribonuclease H-like domain-containing protein n=1 Tax=Hydrotalea sp. TaxID=2881279 RepID=UPI00259008FD|nr:ribonuclease H-like domain-containing protein [Hydrotalea sp.]